MVATVQRSSEERERQQDRRASRFRLREARFKVTKVTRFAGCGRWLNGHACGEVAVKVGDGVAHFSGLQTCGSVWSCPVCAAKIRQARADELEAGIARWLEGGGGVEFVTFTVPHSVGDSLAPLFDLVADGWRKGIVQGDHFRSDRKAFGIAGYARTIEVTYGQHGWHPHVHVLLFTDHPFSDEERAHVGDRMFGRWSSWAHRTQGAVCSREAFKMVGGALGAGAYLVKVQDEHGPVRRLGMEFTRQDLKTGRAGSITPFELLTGVDDGEAWAIRLWWEWEAVTKGRKCLTWSRGMRALLGLGVESTDEEEAAKDQGGEVVLVVAPRLWRLVVAFRAAAPLLAAVERGGEAEAVLLLRTLEQRGSP